MSENLWDINFLCDLIDQLEKGDPIAKYKATIDSLRKLLAELKLLHEFDFRQIGDSLYDGIYITDGDGNTLYINSAYSRITGIKPEEVIGKNVSDLVRSGLYKNAVTPEVIRIKKQVNAMGESSRNGIKMLITGNPLFDKEGNVKKVVVIDREITDLLAMKAELEESQQKIKAVEDATIKKKQEIEHLRSMQLNTNLIGNSVEMQQVIKQISQVANLDVTLLITGETGAGKEVVANEVYLQSSRNSGPFIKVNCAAIPATLLEAELFGYEKGAYTGAATSGKMGLFELADKGTLLLDEIGDMPIELQSKLLRVIQYKEIVRIGGIKPIKLDVRILAVTNCDLKELVKKGRFREDLYYRLSVFPIHIPPLRARAGDIEDLTRHFLSMYNAKYSKFTTFEREALEVLGHYAWPGNSRELQNIIERLVIICDSQAVISAEKVKNTLNIELPFNELLNEELGLKQIVENLERKTIEKILKSCGSTRKAAKILKIDQSTVVKKAKKLGIQISDEKSNHK